jgi:hypothetical protein
MPRPSRTGFVVGACLAAVASLVVPRTATATHCADVECGDLDGSGSVVASDALRLLRNAVGLDIELVCPSICVDTPTTTTTTTVTTLTVTTTSTTTTTTLPGTACAVVVRLDDQIDLAGLQFEVDYTDANGEFVGEGLDVSCVATASAYDNEAERRITFAASQIDIEGPRTVLQCDFVGEAPEPSDFAVTFKDAVLPGELFTGNTTGVCGAPVTGLLGPTIRDDEHVLRVSAGQPGACPLCECDVTNDGTISATDALRVRQARNGEPVNLDCPACGYPPQDGEIGDPVSLSVTVGCF